MKIGVIGNGFVGKATYLLKNIDLDILVYDIIPSLCNPIGTTLKDLTDKCDIIFISVPTPMNKDGSCHLNILESLINEISTLVDLNQKLIVIRSTIPPGTSSKLNCFFMPEFLTEKNFKQDFINNEEWIFGLKKNNDDQNNLFKQKIKQLFDSAYKYQKIKHNNINFVSNDEAEMIKLFRNTFLCTKISFCNEIEEFCRKKNINYNTVKDLAVLDKRITNSHTNVPGHDGKYGFGGTCFPKDIHNLQHEMTQTGMQSYIIKSTIDRNEKIDRTEKDWTTSMGRSVI